MDITSLIITFVGIIIILALYIISRISRSKLPQEKAVRLPNLKNEDGTKFTSVLDDIPARDGYTPTVKSSPQKMAPNTTAAEANETPPSSQKNTGSQQPILFISANDEAGLDGNLVAKVFKKNGLVFGEFDVYHYLVNIEDEAEKASLFRIANGVAPWTLSKEDLHNKKLAGLSIVLVTPCKIDKSEAVKTFVAISHKISLEVDGVLKNNQQQVFTPKDESLLINSL
ncbi:MAG: cell division protein ZipA C-terminal FtsZ-binding domain-containing protein [Cocleimonas sp.]|nr:cell division protein ZipA C-terminal FtsZ-binding domain-containing protein [Cocleimonas sp.]